MYDIERRVARLERTNARQRWAITALLAALAGSVLLGAQRGEAQPRIDGFSAVVDRAGGLSYFRLVDGEYVQTLDTSRRNQWVWRRIRNWPGD